MTEQILAVQRMQDYIEEHLEERIGIEELARVSLFSPWHSYRLFRSYIGLTPSEYIRRLRLAKAALRLKKEHLRITDAALDFGFGSVDGFTRAFHREFKMCPGTYAASPVPIALFVPYGAKFRALKKEPIPMEGHNTVFIQKIRKPLRKVLVKYGIQATDYFSYCAEVGCAVWGILLSMDSLCGEPVCLWLPEKYRKQGSSAYVQGVETALDYSGRVPDGFGVLTLPEAEYLMFQGEPFEEENYCQAISTVEQAMDRYDPSVLGYCWDEENPRIQLEPKGQRGYIEFRAVKPTGKQG